MHLQRHDLDSGISGCQLRQVGDCVGLVVFNADNGFVYVYGFHQQCDAYQYLFAFFHHQGMVGGKIRFAFDGIDDDDLGLASGRRHQFHLCREGGSPQTYDTGCCNLVDDFFG